MTDYRINNTSVSENIFGQFKCQTIQNNAVLQGRYGLSTLPNDVNDIFADNDVTFEELQSYFEQNKSMISGHKSRFDAYSYRLFGFTPYAEHNTPVSTENHDGQHYMINSVVLPDTFWNSREYINGQLHAAFLATADELSEVGKDNNLTSEDILYLMDRNHDSVIDTYEVSLFSPGNLLPESVTNPFIRGLIVFGIDVNNLAQISNTVLNPTTATAKDKALLQIQQDGLCIMKMTAEQKADFNIARAAILKDERAIDHIDASLLENMQFLSTLKNYDLMPYVYERIVDVLQDQPEKLETLAMEMPFFFPYLPQSFRESKAFVTGFLASTQLPGNDDIKFIVTALAETLKSDRDIALLAVKLNGRALPYFPIFQNDPVIVTEALRTYGGALRWASADLQNKRDIVLASANTQDSEIGAINTLEHANARFKKDKEVVLAVLNHSRNSISWNPNSSSPLDYVDPSLRTDRDIMLAAVKVSGWSILTAHTRFLDDKEVVLEAFCTTPAILLTIQNLAKYSQDRMFLSKALEKNPLVWEFIPEDLKNSRDFVLNAVKHGVSLEKIHPDFLYDTAVIREAVLSKARRPIDTALPIFQTEPSLMKDFLLSGRDLCFSRKDFLVLSRELQIVALEQYGSQIYPDILSDDERADRQFIIATAKNMGTAVFSIMPKEFLIDKDVVDAALTGPVTIDALALLPDKVRQSADYVSQAVTKNGLALKYADENLKADRNVVLKAVQENGFALTYASDRLKQDPELVKLANEQLGYAYFAEPVMTEPVASLPETLMDATTDLVLDMSPVEEIPLEQEQDTKKVPTQKKSQTKDTQTKPRAETIVDDRL